jgi:hypothetical protein
METIEKSGETGKSGNPMTAGKQRDWRKICEEVLKERKTEKVNTLLEELVQALDRRAREGDHAPDSRRPKQ